MNNSLRSDSLSKTLGGRIIFLVGMMGSGKSETGPYLADALQYSFVDQDALIEEIAKMSISEIFQEEGENGFRNLETQVLKEIGKRHSLVIATGGGVVMRSENWGILHQGIVVWIDTSREQLIVRLKSDQSRRPLLENHQPINSLDLLIKERYPFYSESDLHVPVEEETPKEVALLILKKLLNTLIDPRGSDAQRTTAP